jgi:hypothetical protein
MTPQMKAVFGHHKAAAKYYAATLIKAANDLRDVIDNPNDDGVVDALVAKEALETLIELVEETRSPKEAA